MDEFDEMVQTVYDVEDLGKFRKYQTVSPFLDVSKVCLRHCLVCCRSITEVETSPLGKQLPSQLLNLLEHSTGVVYLYKALSYARGFVGAV